MSSFSSVIRKPGAQVAPKVAPRRNIQRKVPQPQPQVDTVSAPAATAPDAPARTQSQPQSAEGAALQSQASTTQYGGQELRDLQPERAELEQNDVNETVQPQSLPQETPTDTNGSITSTASDDTRAPWPSQKPRPDAAGLSKTSNRSLSAAQRTPSIERTSTPDNLLHSTGDTNATASEATATTGSSNPVPSSPRMHKKRKQPSNASANTILAQPTIITPPTTTQPSQSPVQDFPSPVASRRADSVISQRSEAEEQLDGVNASLQKVRDIAAEISRNTPASAIEDEVIDKDVAASQPRKRRRKNDGQAQSVEQQAADIVANALAGSGRTPSSARGGRRRAETPENAEEYQIDPEKTNMLELLDDKHKWGKKSDLEKQIQANWPEILRRRKEDAEQRLVTAQAGRSNKKEMAKALNSMRATAAAEEELIEMPEMGIQNGEIVVVSREVDRSVQTNRNANKVQEVREDDVIYKRVNSSTVGSRQQIAPGQHWDDSSTEMFYQGLKMFGTDFKMISNMIPTKNRRQVKLKYNVEERLNWPRIQRSLGQKEEVNLETYAQMTGMEMSNVADVYKQMEEDEKRLREEDEERRRTEGIISQDQADANADGAADVAIPSIESQEAEAAADGSVPGTTGDRASTAAASRLGSTTTGRQTAQPVGTAAKKKKQTKAPNPNSKRGRAAAAKKQGAEGVEERLGDVDSIGIPTN